MKEVGDSLVDWYDDLCQAGAHCGDYACILGASHFAFMAVPKFPFGLSINARYFGRLLLPHSKFLIVYLEC